MRRERICASCRRSYDRFDHRASSTHCASCLHPPLSEAKQAAEAAKIEARARRAEYDRVRYAAKKAEREARATKRAARAMQRPGKRVRGPRPPDVVHASYVRNIEYYEQYRQAHAAQSSDYMQQWRQRVRGTEWTCAGCGATFLRLVDGASASRCQPCQSAYNMEYKAEQRKRKTYSVYEVALDLPDGAEAEITFEDE